MTKLLPDVIELKFTVQFGSILVEGDDILDGLWMGLLFLTRDTGFL